MRLIYLIEIRAEHEECWTPMYQPCYSVDEARAKAKLKVKWAGEDRVRISQWQKVGDCEL